MRELGARWTDEGNGAATPVSHADSEHARPNLTVQFNSTTRG